ncbi:unnamed protein product [Linum trigynum]|uniref:Leucine-rich repeat-containing N-terminal plant-type domain-containing protein n=1 Tax=Linum trigynum TaxID=586398 RepID=A0AAV2G6D0_9ROSI
MMATSNSSRLVRLVIATICLAAATTSSCSSNDLQELLKLKSTAMSWRLPCYYSGFLEWDPNRFPTNDSSIVHCSFPGVTCNSDSRVVALDTSYRFLYGPIPGEIGLLSNLENLTITNDVVVTGPLPVEMAKLTSLKLLSSLIMAWTDVSRQRSHVK